jgi:hypothetical protein
MNQHGESCYPSIEMIAKASGLSKRAVITHLDTAEKEGFLTVQAHGFRGQKWKRNEYSASFPDKKGGERPAPRPEKGGEPHSKGGEPHDMKVVNHVHQDKNNPVNNPKNNPLGGREREALDLIRQALPDLTRLLGPKKVILQTDTRRFLRACGKLPDETPQRILDAVTLYAKSEARDWKGPDANKRKRLAVILDDGLFETFLIPEVRNVDTDFAAKLAAADRALEERNAA